LQGETRSRHLGWACPNRSGSHWGDRRGATGEPRRNFAGSWPVTWRNCCARPDVAECAPTCTNVESLGPSSSLKRRNGNGPLEYKARVGPAAPYEIAGVPGLAEHWIKRRVGRRGLDDVLAGPRIESASSCGDDTTSRSVGSASGTSCGGALLPTSVASRHPRPCGSCLPAGVRYCSRRARRRRTQCGGVPAGANNASTLPPTSRSGRRPSRRHARWDVRPNAVIDRSPCCPRCLPKGHLPAMGGQSGRVNSGDRCWG
jgi:hypothetical protein